MAESWRGYAACGARANHTGNMADTIPPMGVQPYGFFADITGAVKQAVSIPVSTSGRIIDPEMGEGVLRSGKADMIGIGRALLADPDWANKAAAGRPVTSSAAFRATKAASTLS